PSHCVATQRSMSRLHVGGCTVWVLQALASCRAAIVFIGREMPNSVLLEAAAALETKIEVVPVLVGSAVLPTQLRELQAIHLPDGLPGPRFVEEVAKRLGL